jgi:signal transduction histidine kinase
MWVWFAVGVTFAFHVVAARAVTLPDRRMGASLDLWIVISAINVLIWAMSGFGYFWPVWPILGVGVWVGIRALIEYRHELPWVREQALVRRVEELTRTRAGALDVQAEELRRIERDLHDGAQARLVALSMLAGRAEAQLDDRPEVAELVRQAREEAGAAIRELRDLARGIAPPVLADRGLVAAVESLAVRSPMPVEVDAPPLGRLVPAVETAAYFVVAEALTNAAKHGGGAPATARLDRRGDVLRVEVADTGPGGADPGRGSGLSGLRSRVAALDGTLTVASPSGAGTTIVAELPCGS